MASRSLGALTLLLILQMGGFEKGWDRAARVAARRMREIENGAAKLAKVIGAFLGLSVAGAVTAVTAGVKSAIDNMDQLRDASIRLGIGVETLSGLGYAAQQTGTDIEALGSGFKSLAKNMVEALDPKSGKADIFAALGIRVTDTAGRLKDFEQIIPEIADKFKLLEDGATKAALAQELFGKSGLNLIEFLNQGGDGIKKFIDRARELGIVIDQDTALKADQFNDTLADLKGAVQGLAIQVAEDLLPDLIKLTEWATDFVVEGREVGDTAHGIANGFRDIIAIGKGFGQLIGFLEPVRDILNDIQGAMVNGSWVTALRKEFQEAIWGQSGDWDRNGFVANQRNGPIPKTALDNMFTVPGLTSNRFDATAPRFSAVGTGNFQVDQAKVQAALARLNPDKDKSKTTKKEGKSDEEKEAERLESAYKSMNDRLKEQVALFGQDGEAAKLRYELEFGELAKLDPLKKQELLNRAESLDLMRAEEEQMKKSMDLAKKEAEEKLRGVESADAMIRDMRFELELLTMTNKERERAIALRYADINATDEQRAEIARLADAYYDAAQVAGFWEEAQRGISDAIVDVVSGSKSAGDAIKEFFDQLAQYIMRAIADQWAEKIAQLFVGSSGGGMTGSVMNPITGATETSGGSNAGFWTNLIGAFFGGGRASGGSVSAGMFYRVNENGPEMLTVAGRDYLMMGASVGRVTPNHAIEGAGLTQVNNFNYAAPYDARVEAQKNARVAFEANRTLQRNR